MWPHLDICPDTFLRHKADGVHEAHRFEHVLRPVSNSRNASAVGPRRVDSRRETRSIARACVRAHTPGAAEARQRGKPCFPLRSNGLHHFRVERVSHIDAFALHARGRERRGERVELCQI